MPVAWDVIVIALPATSAPEALVVKLKVMLDGAEPALYVVGLTATELLDTDPAVFV